MHTEIILDQFMETEKGTVLMITVPNKRLGDMLLRKHIKKAEIRFDDGRHISAEQRRKARDILACVPKGEALSLTDQARSKALGHTVGRTVRRKIVGFHGGGVNGGLPRGRNTIGTQGVPVPQGVVVMLAAECAFAEIGGTIPILLGGADDVGFSVPVSKEKGIAKLALAEGLFPSRARVPAVAQQNGKKIFEGDIIKENDSVIVISKEHMLDDLSDILV